MNDVTTRSCLDEANRRIADLERQLAAATAERDRLAEWKASAISVTPPLQKIARELSVPLGESIHDKILPGIVALKAERDALLRLLHRVWAQNNPNTDTPEPDWLAVARAQDAAEAGAVQTIDEVLKELTEPGR